MCWGSGDQPGISVLWGSTLGDRGSTFQRDRGDHFSPSQLFLKGMVLFVSFRFFLFFENFAYFRVVRSFRSERTGPPGGGPAHIAQRGWPGRRRPRRAGARCDKDKIGGNRRTVSMIGPTGLATSTAGTSSWLPGNPAGPSSFQVQLRVVPIGHTNTPEQPRHRPLKPEPGTPVEGRARCGH